MPRTAFSKPDPRLRKNHVRGAGAVWIPASNYYVLAFAIGAGIFFLTWGVLIDEGDNAPWIPAGIAFSGFMVVSVLGREVVLRKIRNRRLALQRTFDKQLADVQSIIGETRRTEKLTLERNERMIEEIRRKSAAADAFGSIAAAQREVFELCAAYLSLNDRELPTVGIGSPRLAALAKGRERVARLHRTHMLQWAQIEARDLARDAATKSVVADKVELTNRALNVVDIALGFYPNEASLRDSRELLAETIVSIRVAGFVESAERAVFRGDYAEARSDYRDALYYLGRDGVTSVERQQVADRIHTELSRIEREP